MKVYSLYHNDEFVASFPTKESAVFYGKQFYEDGWSCNIVEEYLSKSPILYNAPYTLTPSQTIPCNPGISPNITKNFIRNSGKIFGTLTVNWISFLMNHLKKMRMDTVNFKCGI